jgi:4-hydroxybenzoate polyprenyltransferase
MNVRPLWSLLRPVLWPTAVADAFLGTACARLGGATMDLQALPFAAGFSLFLYGGGMVLNDLCDVSSDRAEGKNRPIVTGDITRSQAWIVLAFLWGCAAFLAYKLPSAAWPYALLCASVVAAYNLVHKRLRTVSPFLMGTARALGVLTAATAAGLSTASLLSATPVIAVVCAYSLYVVAVTFFSLLEDSADKINMLFSFGAALLCLACAWPLLDIPEPGQPHLWFFLMLFIVLMFITGGLYVLFSARYRPALPLFVPFALAPLTLLGGMGFVFLTFSEKGSPVIVPGLVLAGFYPLIAGAFSIKAARLVKKGKGQANG